VNPRPTIAGGDHGFELVPPLKAVASSSTVAKPPLLASAAKVGGMTKKQTKDFQEHFLRHIQHYTRLHPGPGLPVPNKLRTTLTYVQEIVTTGGSAGTLFSATFGMNCLFNPYISGSGHQPMGFDQLMTFYALAQVRNATIKVTAVPGTTSTVNLPLFGIEITENQSYSPTSVSVIVERGNSVWGVVPEQAAYQRTVSVQKEWIGSQWYPKTYLTDESNANTAAANPTGEVAYGQVWGLALTGAHYDDFYVLVEIVYDVEFYGELQTNPS
jgi:hypothetical protein